MILNTITTGRLLALTVLALVIWAPLAAEGPSCRVWHAEWLGAVITYGMLLITGIILVDWIAELFLKRPE